MKFGDQELDDLFACILEPAVAETGYQLFRNNYALCADLIDDQIRLDARASCFTIADLSHARAGMDWESGYVEGLGRPVIYKCCREVFDDATPWPYFDTNHHFTVVSDPADLQAAAAQLKTIIRVILADEAILEDKT